MAHWLYTGSMDQLPEMQERVERGGQEDLDGVDIPGRIGTTRWIDISEGRPRDVGYDACV
jgi:hypothetical protein